MSPTQEDSFVKVWFDDFDQGIPSSQFHKVWADLASAKHSSPVTYAADALRRIYPKHSLVLSDDAALDIFSFPGVTFEPLNDVPLSTATTFVSLSRQGRPIPGTLLDRVLFGGFTVSWNGHDFVVFILFYPSGFGYSKATYLLHPKSEDHARSLILAQGLWRNELHNEIWVFNQGYWQKDAGLYREVQKANWDDIILKDEFKKNLQKDVYGFFSSEELYKKLAIPWKRGLIMMGPPGNGKTISLKAIMKDCGIKGYAPVYVKSFQSYAGEEYAMALVFNKARELAPCVIVLEDLDSLINDRNRSFFLNQVDGLSGNDGLFLIATTNHFDRLDPGLSTRPSRFDRNYNFRDPGLEERILYAQYWQNKLVDNQDISFPDSLVSEFAESTTKFSFAYLKEAFVSTLVTLAGYDGEKPEFAEVLGEQVKALRKQLDRRLNGTHVIRDGSAESGQISAEASRDIRALESLSDYIATRESHKSKVFTTWDLHSEPYAEAQQGTSTRATRRKEYRAILDRIAAERGPNANYDPLSFMPPVPGAWGLQNLNQIGK